MEHLHDRVSGGNTTTPSQMSYGTYATVNDAIELTGSDGSAAHGAVGGNLVTLLDGGFSLVYRR